MTDADLGDLADYFVAFGFSFAFELAFVLVLFAMEVLEILPGVGLDWVLRYAQSGISLTDDSFDGGEFPRLLDTTHLGFVATQLQQVLAGKVKKVESISYR